MMQHNVRLTQPALKVLRLFMEKPNHPYSGAQITKAIKVGPGTLYPMLVRLESAGWLTSEWERIDPRQAARPRRRFYKLSGIGYRHAHSALLDVQLPTGELAWIS